MGTPSSASPMPTPPRLHQRPRPRRLSGLVLVGALATVAWVGCGGGDEGASEGTEPAVEQAAPLAADQPAGQAGSATEAESTDSGSQAPTAQTSDDAAPATATKEEEVEQLRQELRDAILSDGDEADRRAEIERLRERLARANGPAPQATPGQRRERARQRAGQEVREDRREDGDRDRPGPPVPRGGDR